MMPDAVAHPITLSFNGGDAEHHMIDAMYLGESLQGTARLYNSVAHFWFSGDIPKRLIPISRIQVGPPLEGSIAYSIWIIATQGKFLLAPQLLFDLADKAIPPLVKAVFARRAGRNSEMEKALEIIGRMAQQNADFAGTVHRDHVSTEARLLDIVDNLTKANTPALREIAAPIGPSVKSITHFSRTADEYEIDEPQGEVFQSKEEMVVGDVSTYRGKLVAVDKVAGTCRLEVGGSDKPIRCKITDPALQVPLNVYTHTLDAAALVEVIGKPVIKAGEVSTLYISDAHPL